MYIIYVHVRLTVHKYTIFFNFILRPFINKNIINFVDCRLYVVRTEHRNDLHQIDLAFTIHIMYSY